MKILKHAFILIITQCHFDSTSVAYKQSEKEHIYKFQLDRITELTWNPELAIWIAVQIQDKFKLFIQDTWNQGKITLIFKIDRIR